MSSARVHDSQWQTSETISAIGRAAGTAAKFIDGNLRGHFLRGLLAAANTGTLGCGRSMMAARAENETEISIYFGANRAPFGAQLKPIELRDMLSFIQSKTLFRQQCFFNRWLHSLCSLLLLN